MSSKTSNARPILTRTVIPACIALFWVAMMVSLIWDRIIPAHLRAHSSLIDAEILALRWQDIHEWNWIKRAGKFCGGTALAITREEIDEKAPRQQVGFLLAQNTDVTIPVFGIPQNLKTKLAIDLSPEFIVQRFSAVGKGFLMSVACDGFVRRNRLYYRISSLRGAEKEEKDRTYTYGFLDLDGQPLSLQQAIMPMMSRHFDVQVGKTYAFDVFEPLGGMATGKVKVEVAAHEAILYNGKNIMTYRIETTHNNITRRAWVDEGGHTLRREMPMGLVAERGGRTEIWRAYPSLLKDAAVPEWDEEEFIRRATEAAAAPASSPADSGALDNLMRNL